MKSIKIIFGLIYVLVSSNYIQAQELYSSKKLDLRVLFEINNNSVNRNFSNNERVFKTLDSIFFNTNTVEKIKTIEIYSSASIDGSYVHNQDLSNKRIVAVRNFLRESYPNVPQSIFVYRAIGENWEDFRECVAADPNVPHKDVALDIIDSSNSYDKKENDLRYIKGGVIWEYLVENIFPFQRYGVGVVFIPKNEEAPIIKSYYKEEPKKEEPAKVVEEPVYEPEPVKESLKDEVYDTFYTNPRTILALKTNLLSDVLTAINAEIEVPIGERFSLSGELTFPWWRGVKSDFTMQILSGQIEAKYWLGDRSRYDVLTGFSAGLYGGLGTYDIQPFSKSGASGDFFNVGVVAGYAHPIAKNLNLEYEVGLGYVHSDYHIYDMETVDKYGYIKEVRDGWEKKRLNSVLPTRLKVSLVWLIKTK